VTVRTPLLLAASTFCVLTRAAGAAPPIAEQTFDCVIEARQTVKLASSALGMVAELRVDRGDVVRQNQLLGKLDDRVEAANMTLAKAKAANDYEIIGHQARLDWLSKKTDRAQQLSSTRIVSRNTRDEDETDMKVEAQQLRLAELQRGVAWLEAQQAEAVLAQRSFVSPINGVVVERLLSVGEYRNDQSPILTLAEIDPLRVEVFVPTMDYGQIQIGSIGHVSPVQPVGGVYGASVTIVDKVIDAASGTFGIRFDMPNRDLLLPAGLKCKIRFDGKAGGPGYGTAPQRPPAGGPKG
jgi:RND family efflux transporter MFP subunit